MKPLIATGLLTLWTLTTAGMCSTGREPVIRTVEVNVPVIAKCAIDTSGEPDRSGVEATLKSGEPADMLRALYAYFRLDGPWHDGVKAQVKACAGE